jgi:hypothetical protein
MCLPPWDILANELEKAETGAYCAEADATSRELPIPGDL